MKRLLGATLVAAVLSLVAMGSACTTNPLKSATGIDEQAYAVLGTYQAYQKLALKSVNDTTAPASVRRAVANTDAIAYPILKSLDGALADYLEAKLALSAGTTSSDKLVIATTNLDKWIKQATDAVNSIKGAVQNAKKPTASLTLIPRSSYA